jgi:hypothetical protein
MPLFNSLQRREDKKEALSFGEDLGEAQFW